MESKEISILALKEFCTEQLEKNNIDYAKEKVDIFLMDFLDISKKEYILENSKNIYSILLDKKEYFFKSLEDLKKGYPVEYITNKKYIWESEFFVKEGVLIPRLDSEVLIEEGIREIKERINKYLEDIKKYSLIKTNNDILNLNLLDLCAGSGVIGISILKSILDYLNYLKREKNIDINVNINMYFIDISDIAIDVLKTNIKNILFKNEKYKRFNLGEKIFVLKSDLFEEYQNAINKIEDSSIKKYYLFDYIFSNPPYIKEDKIESLGKDVQKEPKIALNGGKSGLEFYERILKEGADLLKEKGLFIFEIGYDQANEIEDLVRNVNFEIKTERKINSEKYILEKIIKDIEGRDRIIKIRKV